MPLWIRPNLNWMSNSWIQGSNCAVTSIYIVCFHIIQSKMYPHEFLPPCLLIKLISVLFFFVFFFLLGKSALKRKLNSLDFRIGVAVTTIHNHLEKHLFVFLYFLFVNWIQQNRTTTALLKRTINIYNFIFKPFITSIYI